MHVPSRAAHGFINVGKTTGRLLMVGEVEQEKYSTTSRMRWRVREKTRAL